MGTFKSIKFKLKIVNIPFERGSLGTVAEVDETKAWFGGTILEKPLRMGNAVAKPREIVAQHFLRP